MKKLIILTLLLANSYADVNQAVDNFFNSISPEVNVPTVASNQSAGVLSFGGIATRSRNVNLQPMTFTPPSFSGSCGNINFYSGALTFITNTDQLIQFMQNTLMTSAITAVITALKAATPNIAGTLESMFDEAQKMLGMFNSSCQLGMALGNSADSWLYDRIAKAKSQSYSDSADASDAEINSTVNGGGSMNLAQKMAKIADNYHDWVNKNATMNPNDTNTGVQDMASKYGSIIWKGLQALHLYNLPLDTVSQEDVANIGNLVISLTGDLIIYSPTSDGTGTAARVIPPAIIDIRKFMTSGETIPVYNCSYFSTTNPGECTGTNVDLATMTYPSVTFNGGIMKTIETAITDIQDHFVQGKDLTQSDLLIIAISPIPIFAIAQALDDIGMSSSIDNFLNAYKEQIAFEILQKLINVTFSLANQAAATRTNKNTAEAIQTFTASIANLQAQVNSYSSLYVKKDPVKIIQDLNYLRGYAQNLMSPMIMQKVNFAKQMSNY